MTLGLAENITECQEKGIALAGVYGIWQRELGLGQEPRAGLKGFCVDFPGTQTQEGEVGETSGVNTQQPDSGGFFLGLSMSLIQVWPESEAFTKPCLDHRLQEEVPK